MVKIGTIKGKMTNLNVVGRVDLIMNQPKPDRKFAMAQISDETGKIWLALWRDQVDQVKEGDTILIVNAFTRPVRKKPAIQTWQHFIPKVSPSEMQKAPRNKANKSTSAHI